LRSCKWRRGAGVGKVKVSVFMAQFSPLFLFTIKI
jgi:hypothetical protein